MEFHELAMRLGLAIGIGLLIGLERGWTTRSDQPGTRTAGIRTFTITGVLGGVTGALADLFGRSIAGAITVGLGFAAYAAVMAVFCLEENRAERQFSATTWVAAVLTFALGALALLGDMRAAAALAVLIALLLALREPLHGWVRRLTSAELHSVLVLLAMSFIALPIIPDYPVGPFGGINPREVWLIAIALAAVSFAGYVAVKFLGQANGVLLSGVAGSLVSSTAVTVINARRAAVGEGAVRLLAAGVAIASTVMFLRVCAIVVVMSPALLARIAPPLVGAALVSTAYALALAYWRPARAAAEPAHFRNPFAFWSVIGFALFLALILLAAQVVNERLGSAGAIAGAAVIGFVDVDAIAVSLAKLAPQSLGYEVATRGILIAVVTNTISKVVIGGVIGRGRFALHMGAMAAGCLAGGLAGLWVTVQE